MDAAVNTNNPIADAVLNQKCHKAREHNIQMQFQIGDLSRFPLTSDELVTVISNLLDNAIEASAKCEGKREIRIKLLLEPALATLAVQNTSLPVVLSPAGEVSTSKINSKNHGFGLRNSKKILEKSGFTTAIRYENGSFLVAAIKAM